MLEICEIELLRVNGDALQEISMGVGCQGFFGEMLMRKFIEYLKLFKISKVVGGFRISFTVSFEVLREYFGEKRKLQEVTLN